MAQKYAQIFVRGHYLFRDANSFPRAKLEENCELRGTDNVQGQISEHIFAPNGGYCLYIKCILKISKSSTESQSLATAATAAPAAADEQVRKKLTAKPSFTVTIKGSLY